MPDDAPENAPTPGPERPTERVGGWLGNGRAGLVALAVSVLALGVAGAPYLTGGDFGGRVRAYLLANPQVLDEVVAARDVAARTDRTSGINAAVARNPGVLAPAAGEPAFGPTDARVTVTEFFDYRCPYCKMAAPEYLELMRANPDVRFVFREWPVLDQGDDVTSHYAARAALAAHAQGKYLAVHQALMAQSALSIDDVDRILVANGVDLARARATIAATDTSRLLADIHTGAATMGLEGTPTFFINGKVTGTNNPADLARVIAEAKQG
ncbi:thioredoxin domain-containing protein [uncultured Brevundimonas sp.]|uniref:DsbA family protein n=1 Tax=uncultured Brevundimonas sp. TaxID=213418 RepID=UPI0030EE7D5C|tara:strand:+ start:2271 stop:3077 length:807 start_codon:yes stop_codon:yes gene_type:complete